MHVQTILRYLPMLWIVSSILLVLWVNLDCGATGQDGLFWGVAVFIFNVPGLIIYYLVTRLNIGPGPKRRELVLRDKDDKLRKMYSERKGGTTYQGGGLAGDGSAKEPDIDYIDPGIEKMLADGRNHDAVMYIEDLMIVAEDMNDEKMLANLKKYRARVSLQPGTIRKGYEKEFVD